VRSVLSRPDGECPRVVGLRTGEGDVSVDVVVDATGRRSPVDRWLDEIGAHPALNQEAECGLAYFSRHYRLRAGVEPPAPPTIRMVIPLDEFMLGLWGADNGAMQVAISPLAADGRFRSVKDPAIFDAVLRTVPSFAVWLDALDPITPVYPMAGLHNTLRRLVVEGTPVVTGLHAVGDAVCTTNPTLSRGMTLALATAADLTDVLAKEDDPVQRALVHDGLVAEHVVPYYDDQVVIDGARLAVLRHQVFGVPVPDPVPADPSRVEYWELRSAARFDPASFRAFWEVQAMVRRPEDVYSDPVAVAATRAALEHIGSDDRPAQPTRAELDAVLRGERTGRATGAPLQGLRDHP
jgi:hypothetical protein